MNNQSNYNNSQKKGIFLLILGLLIGGLVMGASLGIRAYFRIQKDLLQTKIINEIINNKEPTDISICQHSLNNNAQVHLYNSNTNLISFDKAKDIAINKVGGGHIISSEQDIYDNDDLPTYNFKIRDCNNIYEVEINAITGEVIDFDID